MTRQMIFKASRGATLNDFLRAELPKAFERNDLAQEKSFGAVSNSKIRRLIFSQNVWISQSGQSRGFALCKNPSIVLQKNALVKVFLDSEKFFYQKQNDDIKFELDEKRVLYEDDAIIVVNKPARFPTDATFVQDRDNLRAAVVRYLHKKIGLDKNPPYCGIVHRLDRDTSGVILFSKRRDCNAALFAAFDSSGAESFGKPFNAAPHLGLASDSACCGRVAKKKYIAVCAPAQDCSKAKSSAARLGLEKDFCAGDEFSVQNYLGRVSPKAQAAKWGLVPKEKGGKFARTDFKVLEKLKGVFLIEAELKTGRTHQIRVHLSQKGLPILGDELYGGRADKRIFLHALLLELPHPVDGRQLRFEAPLSPEFFERV